MPLAADAFHELLDQARFADAGLALDQHDSALAGARGLPALEQRRELALAADERAARAASLRLESRLALLGAQHPPARHRRGVAVHVERAEQLELEGVAQQRLRRLAYDQRVRLGEDLQARGEIRRLSPHRHVHGDTRADELADDRHAGGDGDVHAETSHLRGHLVGELDGGHCLDDLETRAHRALRAVLERARKTEQHPDLVALVFAHEAVVATDDGGAGALVGAQHQPVLLRIQRVGELRRADQIAEHDAQMAAFRSLRERGIESGRRMREPGERLVDVELSAAGVACAQAARIRHRRRPRSDRGD